MDITIIAKTELGTAALKQHIEESLKMGRVKKAALRKLGFTQEITSENPLTLVITAKPGSLFSQARPEYIIMEIDKALKENGAVKGQDYEVLTE